MKHQNVKSFEKHLSNASSNPLCQTYLVALADDCERLQILQKVAQKLLHPDTSLQKFSLDSEIRELFEALQSPSLFGGNPVVLFDGCEALKKKEVELIAEFLEKNAFCGFLLLGSRGKTPLSKVIEKTGIVLDMSEEKPWDKEKRLAETLSEIAKREGKRISSDAIPLLLEQVGEDVSLLTQEILKLVCYVGDRPTIERSDILQMGSFFSQQTMWQAAEELVWEGRSHFDSSMFPGILFSIRPQLQLGLKITSLLEERIPFPEWGPYFSKIWPRTLEKRRDQAMQKGSAYFKKGLSMLFQIETLSRSGSLSAEALFDLFRTSLRSYQR